MSAVAAIFISAVAVAILAIRWRRFATQARADGQSRIPTAAPDPASQRPARHNGSVALREGNHP